MKEALQKQARELIRRGYNVTESATGGLLVEKKTFWGKYSYNTEGGYESGKLNIRTWVLMLIYGIGIVGALYWMFSVKPSMRKEIVAITA